MVAKWLGHSPNVAAAHYLQAREHHFDDVVAGSGASPKSGADCSAPTAQIAAPQHVSEGSGAKPHETPEPAVSLGVTTGSSGITPVIKTGLAGSTGFEPVTAMS